MHSIYNNILPLMYAYICIVMLNNVVYANCVSKYCYPPNLRPRSLNCRNLIVYTGELYWKKIYKPLFYVHSSRRFAFRCRNLSYVQNVIRMQILVYVMMYWMHWYWLVTEVGQSSKNIKDNREEQQATSVNGQVSTLLLYNLENTFADVLS